MTQYLLCHLCWVIDMKKSYIKLFLFFSIISFLFFLNSFVLKFFSLSYLCLFLIFLIFIEYFLFGFEKNRRRYDKDIILEIIIILISFFLLYYLFGIVIGFAKVKNYFTILSIFKFIVPMIFYIILKEFLRYQLSMKSSESKILLVFVCILFIFMDNTIAFASHTLGFNKETFLLVAVTFLPTITENILCSFLTLKFGYLPSICYLLIMKLYRYFLPIVPNPNEYLYSLIFLLLPIFVLFCIKSWLSKDKTESVVLESYKKRKNEIVIYIPIIILIIILVYFISGYFKYYAVAVASGSMEPVISKGDIVIVNQKFENLSNKDIIAYKYEGRIIVHRIYKIVNVDNDYYVYTKGDANSSFDRYKITKDMVIGVVKFKVPLIGYPTVLLNENW